ncbi:MAG: hypothetical protein HYS04_22610 [Acidobacteria bacterium]|nr:hypothetical protein [Acidobacteriota bacterium]
MLDSRFRETASTTRCGLRRAARVLTVGTLVMTLAAPPSFSGQPHVVALAELQADIVRTSQARQRNRDAVAGLLSSPRAEAALRAAHLDLKQVKTAVATLSDEDLARLAARSQKVEADLAAGRLTDRDLILILVGLAALILIIVAVD